jgi:hypothetical protein
MRDFLLGWEEWRVEADDTAKSTTSASSRSVTISGRGKTSGLELGQIADEGSVRFTRLAVTDRKRHRETLELVIGEPHLNQTATSLDF